MAINAMTVAEARAQYPQYAWAFDHPDIGPKLRQAVENGWPEGRLTGAIMETGWWKSTEPTLRAFQAKQFNDPAAIDQLMRQRLPDIWDAWMSLGLPVPSEQVINDFARQAISLGWSEGQIRDAMVSRHAMFNPQQPTPVGALGTTMNDLKELANTYYVPLTDETAFNFSRSINSGERKVEDYEVMFRDQAKGRFPSLARYIDQGIRPANFFQPYKSTIAQLLETTPEQIDFLNDPKWSKVIDTVDEKTGDRRPMTLNETQVYARGMTEWRKTRQGQQAAADVANSILETFGKVA